MTIFQLGVLIYLGIINIIACLLYGMDKMKAVQNQWRIPEITLLAFTMLGGALGAWIAMMMFHHKTKKMLFEVIVPLSLVAWIVIVLSIFHIL